jgi:hypothetical protein
LQYVRCDACGAKALFAASRCPKCTHAFFLRNHRGGMVPLAHCRKCDTYYPRAVGGCKWCGTKMGPAGVSGGTMAIAGLVAIALAALVYFQGFARRGVAEGTRSDTPAPASESVLVTSPPPVPVVVDTTSPDTLPNDSAMAATPAAAVAVTTAPTVATVPPPPGSGLPVTTTWTRAVTITFINVRSAADRKAPVVGVINPNMSVELGARLHGWREVRAANLKGWADPRHFKDDSVARR